ncbi:MAG TPA: peptidase U32 family protein [Phycisphaerae bacterium]|nr:peptidase U32 family protein [Phycisphaerae bacterium]HPS52369.1 peptidase U32 family protein [Phycisphaerae bacterium]
MTQHNINKPTPELLAPAGDKESLVAAVQAGANAVYLGIRSLNARRGAVNFSHEELTRVVKYAHDNGVKVFLAVNTDIAAREVGQAVRALEVARIAKVDAVLFTDPLFLAVRKFYPEVAFHFSTQGAIENSAGVEAAGELGADRVVLARELSKEEINAASGKGVETEIFVQGALCFCVSGRCLLSSWGGGRSGNRGTCTSPCRAAWRLNGDGTPKRMLSMHDLSLLEKLDEIRDAGVTCLKIEGRLKKADWVAKAVSIFRHALDEGATTSLKTTARELGDYTGRSLTSGYFDASRENLCGESGRPKTSTTIDGNSPKSEKSQDKSTNEYRLSISTASGRAECTLQSADNVENWDCPLSHVHNEKRSTTLKAVGEYLAELKVQDFTLADFIVDAPALPIARKTANAIIDRVTTTLNRFAKKSQDTTIRVDLPANVRQAVAFNPPSAANNRPLGAPPQAARISFDVYEEFKTAARDVHKLTIEHVPADRLNRLMKSEIPAMPAVFFESALPAMRNWLARCAELDLKVEVNSWAGWRLAKETGVRFEGGPGMMVLNPVAARELATLGFEAVTFSLEADRRQLEDFSANAETPYSLLVFGRPVLGYTRSKLPPEIKTGDIIEDARDIRLQITQDGELTVFRPTSPFNFAHVKNRQIRAAWLVADMVSSPNAAEEWKMLQAGQSADKKTFEFNYNRRLL